MGVTGLRKEVETAFLPVAEKLGLSIAEHLDSGEFDNAMVILDSPEFRVRVIRERGQVFLDVASVADDETWYDLDLIMRVLGRKVDHHFALPASSKSLGELARAVRELRRDLARLFEPHAYEATKRRLENEKSLRAEERFGP